MYQSEMFVSVARQYLLVKKLVERYRQTSCKKATQTLERSLERLQKELYKLLAFEAN